MTTKLFPQLATQLSIALALTSAAAFASQADHKEFEATLHAPYQGVPGAADPALLDARTFTLAFEYPLVERAQDVSWKLELVNAAGEVVQQWHGAERLFRKAIEVKVDWNGRAERAALADGIYQLRMQAVSRDARKGGQADTSAAAVEHALAAGAEEVIEQSWDIALGQTPAQSLPTFRALPSAQGAQSTSARGAQGVQAMTAAPAAAALPYTVYYGNLHSQTNHSDGGGALGSCTGAQAPQSAAFGPSDAYNYAMNRGLDFLMASEHNHMYDGSDGTNASADPAVAKARYQAGLQAASDFHAAHPDFLGMYGMEWGVINNGGHMNIFNSPELLGWESNSGGQLIADTATPKGDYAGLYTLMRQRGWVGQFNHPSSSGQFLVNGVALGYTADGDQAMALCEVLNTSAFSVNTTETETGRSSYEGACNKALEAGYHVAFSTNQDNHCANWGASYTNRTGVLIPTGTPLSAASMIEAIKARRVFATMDKGSQLILTANGRVMGQRFTNSGPLNLLANFASSAGKSVSSVLIYEGVPGRNGSVSQLATTASATVTPSIGEHFYYAKLTQNDGNILWSAPIWVSQSASSDTTLPTVSAAASGSSGTITLSANASDNVGVTLVEFYVDGALKSSSNVAPYTAALNTTTLANGAHTLVARAYDAAGNVGVSSSVAFNVGNGVPQPSQLIVNGGFESGAGSWSATAAVISSSGQAPRSGTFKAKLVGYGAAHTDTLYQQIAIPSSATSVNLSFWLKVVSSETTATKAYDTLKAQVRSSSGALLATLATYSNLDKGSSYVQKSFDLSAFKGQTVRIYFEGIEGSTISTQFLVDDVSVMAQ
ncbi:CehA/McbA family metallohydrolase [Oxalobacteraceae bacterium]|nr:CehA/McbA family metallohydrolase [Oxalobacteraceae bacterium]